MNQMSESTPGNNRFKPFLKGLFMLLVFGLLIFAARKAGLEEALRDREWFAAHIGNGGLLGVLAFMGLAALATGLGLPRQVVALLGGYLFGAALGTLYATIGCGVGCLSVVGYVRYFGRDFVNRRFGGKVRKVDDFLKKQPFKMALAIRFFPLGNNLLTNIAAGVSSIPIWPFVFGSTLGYVPQNLVFSLFGAGMNAESTMGVVISVAGSVILFVASAWLGISLYRRHKAEKAEAAGD